MRFSENWKVAFQAILKNKRRSFLTMIGLVIGISAVITIFSIGRGFERYAAEFMGLDSFDNSVVFYFTPKNDTFDEVDLDGFTQEDLGRLDTIKGVKKVDYDIESQNGIKYASQTIEEAGKTDGMGSIKLLKKTGTKVKAGRRIRSSDNVNGNKVIVLDQKTASSIRKENTSQLVGKSVTLKGQLFEVVGIMPDRPDPSIVSTQEDYVNAEVPRNVYEKYFNTAYTDMIVAKLSKGANVRETTQAIQRSLDRYGDQRNLGAYKSEDLASQVDQLRSILTGITLVVSTIGGISLFISGIGVMNMIYISVSERTREIGVRRAMGATKGKHYPAVSPGRHFADLAGRSSRLPLQFTVYDGDQPGRAIFCPTRFVYHPAGFGPLYFYRGHLQLVAGKKCRQEGYCCSLKIKMRRIGCKAEQSTRSFCLIAELAKKLEKRNNKASMIRKKRKQARYFAVNDNSHVFLKGNSFMIGISDLVRGGRCYDPLI